MAKRTYAVTSPIRYDGKDYAVSDLLNLEDKDASGLLEVKAIEPSTESSAPTAPTDEAERISAIVVAIGQLDKADTALWTNAGTPKTDGLTVITGWPVAAKERDAAWAQINAAK